MTRDHLVPKRLRPDRFTGRCYSPKVDACVSCNQKKGDKGYEEFRMWLLSEEGYWFLHARHLGPGVKVLSPCQVPPVPGLVVIPTSTDGSERHYCAAHKPCGVLRRRLVVVGDGRSVWSDERLWLCDPPRRGKQ